MKEQNVLKLLSNYNYYAQVNICLYQRWESYNTFSCYGEPKENDILVFFNRCKATYTMSDGEVIHLNHGDIVHIPSGKEYTLTVDERDDEYGCTYGINFYLFDSEHRRVILKDNQKFSNYDISFLHGLFQKMSRISDQGMRSFAKLHTLFYEIISNLNDSERKIDINRYSVIKEGIKYLENDTELSMSVLDIANICNVSQNYFCRLFKEYSGDTPQDYILKAKIEKAKNALRETPALISEIAENCGFMDTSYFCRIFKKKTGKTPLDYRRSKN